MTTLNLIEMTRLSFDYKIVLVILIIATIVFFTVAAKLFNTLHYEGLGAVLGAFGMVALVATIILFWSVDADIYQEPTGKFQIEATFSEDMPFLSVMKEYNIIEQRGDIFVLEPKEREID